MRPFHPFRPFDLFRTPPAVSAGGEPSEIPANALVTADGIALQTADGNYLTTAG